MSILSKIGITKDSIAKLLGIRNETNPKPKSWSPLDKSIKRRRGRPKGQKIPQWVVDAVRNSHKTYTAKELSEKYGVSNYWVWAVRNNKFRK